MLYSPKRYLQNPTAVEVLQNGRGGTQWLLSRALCYYHCFDLGTVAARERDTALQLQIEQWSPLTEYGSYRVWQGDKVSVWLWDQEKVNAAQAELNLKNQHAIPETVLHSKAETGLHYMAVQQGIEAQVWQDGVLLSSHWWAKPPSLAQWQRFQRAHHLDLSPVPDMPEIAPWLSKAWGRHKAPLQHSRLLQEDWLLGISLSILISFFAWYGISLSKWQQALDTVLEQQADFSAKVEPILNQRRQALDQQQAIQALLNLNPYPEPLQLLQVVANKLPQQSHLLGFVYQPGKLSFSIYARKIDPRYYVNTFEKSAFFKNVTTENGANPFQIVLKMQVLKQSHS